MSEKLPDLPSSSGGEVIVVIDLGASKTKVIFQDYPNGYPQVVCMDSEVADDVNLDSLMELEVGGRPEDNCWVSLSGEGNYAIGFLSKRFGGNLMLKQLKYDLAIPKVASVLWVVSQKLGISKLLRVRLSVLLPPSEGGDSVALEKKLLEQLPSYQTPTGILRVKLLDFKALREGSGMMYHRRSVLGDSEFNKRNMTVVMVGYRNISILPIVRGQIQKGATSTFGMSWMVNNFVQDCGAGLEADDPKVLKTLVEAGSLCDARLLSSLSRKRKIADIAADGERFLVAARRSRSDYALAVTRWLSQTLRDDTEEIILCGGTARYIKEELCQYYQETGIHIIWDGGIVIPKVLDPDSMGERLADVLGLYQYYVSKLDETKKKNGAAKLALVMQQEQKLVSPPVEQKPDSPSDHVDQDEVADPLAKFDFKPAKRPDVFIKRDW